MSKKPKMRERKKRKNKNKNRGERERRRRKEKKRFCRRGIKGSSEVKTFEPSDTCTLEMDPAKNSHAKLLAFDILALSRRNISSPSSPSNVVVFYRKSRQVCRVETLGVVVTREFKAGKSLKFLIDDGTGCVSCILWLNQLTSSHFSRKNPDDIRILAEIANNHSSKIQIGRLARICGRVTVYRGKIKISVTDVVIERDPNVEILHWLDCVKLARNCYDGVAPNVQ